MRTKVLTTQAPPPIGPYSQGIIASGQFIYVSGQLPLDNKGVLVGSTISEQTTQSLLNVQAILAEGGFTWADVVKTTVYLKNMSDFTAMNVEYAKIVTGPDYPARVAFQVGQLPMDVLVEIEAIAVKNV